MKIKLQIISDGGTQLGWKERLLAQDDDLMIIISLL